MRSRGVCLAPFDSVCSAQTPPRSARVAARSESSPLSRPRGVPPCTRLPVRPAAAGRPGRGHVSAPVSDAALNPGACVFPNRRFRFLGVNRRRWSGELHAGPAVATPIPGATRSHEAPRQPSRAAREVSSACCPPTAASPRRLAAALTSGPGSPLVLSVVPESPPLYKRCGARKKRRAPSAHRAIAGCHGSRVSVRLALRELSGISEICPRTGAVSPNAVASPP